MINHKRKESQIWGKENSDGCIRQQVNTINNDLYQIIINLFFINRII